MHTGRQRGRRLDQGARGAAVALVVLAVFATVGFGLSIVREDPAAAAVLVAPQAALLGWLAISVRRGSRAGTWCAAVLGAMTLVNSGPRWFEITLTAFGAGLLTTSGWLLWREPRPAAGRAPSVPDCRA